MSMSSKDDLLTRISKWLMPRHRFSDALKQDLESLYAQQKYNIWLGEVLSVDVRWRDKLMSGPNLRARIKLVEEPPSAGCGLFSGSMDGGMMYADGRIFSTEYCPSKDEWHCNVHLINSPVLVRDGTPYPFEVLPASATTIVSDSSSGGGEW